MSEEEGGFSDFLFNTWGGQLLLAAIFSTLALLTFAYPEGTRSLHWTTVIVYGLIGRWGVVLLFAFPAVIALYAGVHNLVLMIRGEDR